ncbi:hypothetical protein [Devosia sp. Root635]|uniref:hypothetical protein n=1 Tax=Devosia sp. Root635 TaxID=1736575 RepID=UPI0006F418F3|nr:hypothetical protein [Devosia sp. Root635]KRA53115.1 hypothetical protein ASD80_14095 [Devosia sp. Root635]
MRTTKTARLLLLSGVATVALMGQAMALDAQAFVDRIAEVYKPLGYDFTFGAATLDGDTITVDGGTVTIVSSPDAKLEPMVFDTEVTFSGVVENADGSYIADSVSIPDIDTDFAADPAGHLNLSDILAEGFYLPAGDPVPAIGLIQLFKSFSTGPLSVTRDGEEVFSFESMASQSTFNPAFASTELSDLSSTFLISGISADLTSVAEDDPGAGATIEALGLTNVTGEIYMEMSWAMADGHVDLTAFTLDFDDVGAIDITADLTGFTPAVLDQIYAMQASMGGEQTEEQAQAQMMQGMALMQGVNIVSASIRYDDASLAGKLLDFFAAQSGADRATFVEGLKSMLPMMLAQSGIPALNDLVVPPVSAFLDDPQSIEVKVAPPSPTSLLVLMAAAANPAGLITALGLAVEANQPVE